MIAPLLQFMLERWDWRVGAALFIVLALAMLPAASMAGAVDRIPQPVETRAGMGEVISLALRNRRFVVLGCTYFVCGLQLIFVNTHLPNYLAICGQDPMLSATALAIIGGVNVLGSWTAGWLGGIYPKYILLGLTYLARSLVLMIYFLIPPTPTTTLVFAGVMGMLWLGVIPLVSGYVAELFGTRYMATILGVSFVIHQAGSVIGAWGGGMMFDAYGSYDLAWKIGVSSASGLARFKFCSADQRGLREACILYLRLVDGPRPLPRLQSRHRGQLSPQALEPVVVRFSARPDVWSPVNYDHSGSQRGNARCDATIARPLARVYLLF